jgi:hypothetical protein
MKNLKLKKVSFRPTMNVSILRLARSLGKLGMTILFLLVLTWSGAQSIQAQPSPKVTARIPDDWPPHPAILISPDNGSFSNNPAPLFSFYKAKDDNSTIWYYQLFLNDNLIISQLAAMVDYLDTGPTSTYGAGYTLWGETDKISFKLKEPLIEGNYIWKIRAYDTYGNWVDSAVWTFTVDLTPPQIIINRVDQHTDLNLSSKDPESIPPNTLFVIDSGQPKIVGRSEPSAALKLTLEGQDQLINLLTTADEQGFFEFDLKSLSPGTYTVTISASDAAHNTTTLESFQISLKTSPSLPAIYPFGQLSWLTAEPTCPRIDWQLNNYMLLAILICLLLHFFLYIFKRKTFPLPLYLAIGLGLTLVFLFSTWFNLFVAIGLVFLLIAEGKKIFE